MARGHKPREGSVSFWPKKRAKNIYSRFRSHKETKETVPLDFAGYKAGMVTLSFIDTRPEAPTRGAEVYATGTVLDSPPLVVCGIKIYRKTPYGLAAAKTVFSERLSKDLKRKTSVPNKISTKEGIEQVEKMIGSSADVRLLVHTKPREAFGKKRPELFEVSLGGALAEKWGYAKQKLGNEIKISEVFSAGDLVDVRAVTTGKGFQGPVKRFGIKVRGRKSNKKFRHLGSLGPITPRRVIPVYLPEAGQMGFQTRTEYSKMSMLVSSAKERPVTQKKGFRSYGIVSGDYIILRGSVPGPEKRLVMMRKGIRAHRKTYPVEVRKIVL